MTDGLSESAVVRAVADQAAKHVTRLAIKTLQGMKDTLSGPDSGLKSVWDEICVQAQGEESPAWDAYTEIVQSTLAQLVTAMTRHEREAIWLQTDAGFDWSGQEPNERVTYPVHDQDVIDYLAREYVFSEAGRWSNERITNFLDRSGEID